MSACVQNVIAWDADMLRHVPTDRGEIGVGIYEGLLISAALCLWDVGNGYFSYFLKITVALWPPKPNELLSAARTSRCSALLKVRLSDS